MARPSSKKGMRPAAAAARIRRRRFFSRTMYSRSLPRISIRSGEKWQLKIVPHPPRGAKRARSASPRDVRPAGRRPGKPGRPDPTPRTRPAPMCTNSNFTLRAARSYTSKPVGGRSWRNRRVPLEKRRGLDREGNGKDRGRGFFVDIADDDPARRVDPADAPRRKERWKSRPGAPSRSRPLPGRAAG